MHESEHQGRNGNESDDDAFQENCNSDGEKDQDGEVDFPCLIRKMNEGTFINRNWIPCQTRGKGNLFHWKKIKSANAREA